MLSLSITRRNLIIRSEQSTNRPPNPPDPGLRPDPGPSELITWGGRLPSKRRLLLSVISASSIALGANFLGCTSFLLGLDGGDLASRSRLDVLFPVRGFTRCVNFTYGFEFQYPSQWLADQTLAVRAAQRAERMRSLDLPALDPLRKKSERDLTEPISAFGPPGSSGEENVSVIVAPIDEGFNLESLGSPEDSASRFLATIAPSGSGREATLIEAGSKVDASGLLYYTQEFVVKGPKFERHNISVYTTRNNALITFTATAPVSVWGTEGERLKKSAASFHLLPS